MDGKQRSSPLIEQSTDAHRSSKIPRMSLPEQSEKQSDLGKVCLICYCEPEELQPDGFSFGDGRRCDYCLFLLDLDAEGAKESSGGAAFVPRNPDMCFDSLSLGLSGFCVLGSTLYLFGKEEDVFSYQLPSIPTLPSSSRPLPERVEMLTKDMLTIVDRPMKYAKSCPMGCQTPDGKMLVFSCLLHVSDVTSGKFELFDPAKREWTDLPDLLPHLSKLCRGEEDYLRSIRVSSYSFINNGPVLLICTKLGDFTLDTDNLDKGWSPCMEFRFVRGLYFMLVRDRLCLMDWFPWEDRPWPYLRLSYPVISGLPAGSGANGMGMSWLSSDRFCVSRALVDHATLKPHLVIDVCSFDPKDFQRKKNNLVETTDDAVPGMTLMERFKLVLGPQANRLGTKFVPRCLFSIKPLL